MNLSDALMWVVEALPMDRADARRSQEALARLELLSALASGEVTASGRLVVTSGNVIDDQHDPFWERAGGRAEVMSRAPTARIDRDWWSDVGATIGWRMSAISRPLRQGWELVLQIEVDPATVMRRWPNAAYPDKVPKPTVIDAPPKKREGRPPVYDYEGAASFMIHYVVENDYPPNQADLVKVLEEWFRSEHGKAPDRRELERRVGRLYSTRKT
jgi:hypothetical protein